MDSPNPDDLGETVFHNSRLLVEDLSIFDNILFRNFLHKLEMVQFDVRKI
jgi:hypothetical protein